MQYISLHTHTHYSTLDGAAKIDVLIPECINHGMTAISLTDHGTMSGAVEFYKACKKANIKPIIGNEMYLINGDITKQEKRPKYHLLVLAKNLQGYKNLVKLTTISNLEGVQGKGTFARPCINKEILQKYSDGLIVTSACLGGEIPQAILSGRPDAARKIAQWYKDVFGDDFYLEIQDHGSQEDRVVNCELVEIGKELGIKLVATNDSHYVSCNDVEAHDALLCIQINKQISEENRMRYSGTEYLKSAEEMAELFQDHLEPEVIAEAIANTNEVADKIEHYDIMRDPQMPKFPCPDGKTSNEYMEEVASKGLFDILRKRTMAFTLEECFEDYPKYRSRYEYELKLLKDMGFADYFLVVADYIKFAKDNGIAVGGGRGSAAGSLIAYAMGITGIDPIKHGLLFERFLNPSRKSMPDIDTDFCVERRGEVIDYVTKKYGADKVAQIITFNRLTSKAVLKDVARVMGVPYKQSDEMAKLIPVTRGKPAKLKVMISDETPEPEFKKRYDESLLVQKWVDTAIRIEGTNKTTGVHAAGIVISGEPLDEWIPLERSKDGAIVTQYSMEDIESVGLLKMDFLGLKNLTTIQKTIDLVNQISGNKVNIDDVVDDAGSDAIYQLLESGKLDGLFQLESAGMKQIVKDLKPSNITDISSVLALYRPGPLDAGLIPKFIDRKHGKEQIDYPHPLLESVLQDTYGIMVYQEQIMKIAQVMSGYTLAEADLLRRCLGKKKIEEMLQHKDKFVQGAIANNIDGKLAEDLFEQIKLFASYCFNLSHSMAYAYISYQTAYLKANYPTEYMAALLSANSDDTDRIKAYIADAVSMGIKIEQPNINKSGASFTPRNNSILFGLSAIKNVGETAIHNIISVRSESGEFKSLADFCERVDLKICNTRTIQSLIQCGAFTDINPNRQQLINDLELVHPWAQSRAKEKIANKGQMSLLDLLGNMGSDISSVSAPPSAKPTSDYSKIEILKFEKELLGFYLSNHPLEDSKIIGGVNLSELINQDESNVIYTTAMVNSIKVINTKKGEPMAIVQVEDLESAGEMVAFPVTYKKIVNELKEGSVYLFQGKVDKKKDKPQFIIDFLREISTVDVIQVTLKFEDAIDNNKRDRLWNILNKESKIVGKVKHPINLILVKDDVEQSINIGCKYWVNSVSDIVKSLQGTGFKVEVKRVES